MDKEQIYLEAKSELQVMIVKKKSENEGLQNFDVWNLREKTNKARNAWRAEQRKLKVMVSEPILREQIAKEIVDKCKKETWTIYTDIGNFEVTGCPQETGEDGTILACSHIEDAQIVRGQK